MGGDNDLPMLMIILVIAVVVGAGLCYVYPNQIDYFFSQYLGSLRSLGK